MPLPEITPHGYAKIAGAYVNHYLERDGLRHCFMKLNADSIQNIRHFIEGLKWTPRQAQEVFRILGHTLTASEENRGNLRWSLAAGSIAMAALKVGRPEMYDLLGSEQLEPSDAAEFLKGCVKNPNWWFILFFTGGGLKVDDETSEKDVLASTGLFTDPVEVVGSNYFQQWEDGWGWHSSSRIAKIYNNIESISLWS